MLRISNPVPTFLDGQGNLLDDGQIWIGAPSQDPQENPIQVYWDPALTIPAVQPLQTLSGTIRNGGSVAFAYVSEDDFSMLVADSNGAQVSYSKSYKLDNQSFQPYDSDLTAIAALSTTAYGRALLTLANQNALTTLLGGLNFLPSSGGTVTGDIIRQGYGALLLNGDPAAIGGGVFTTDAGAPDPTLRVGDWWAELA